MKEKTGIEQGIVKEYDKRGCTIYRREDGTAIHTYSEPLYDVMSLLFEQIDAFIEMLIQQEITIGTIKADLVYLARDAFQSRKENIMNVMEYIEAHHGTIEIERASYHQKEVEPETKLGIVFYPCEE